MILRTLSSGLILFSSFTSHSANAGEILNSDQVNLLTIARRSLIEQRAEAIAQIIENERKIEILLGMDKDGKPATLVEKVAPAASAVVTGGVATAYLIKHMPEVIARLPLSVQRVIKATPAVAGLVAGLYFGFDSAEYHKITGQLTTFNTPDKRAALYIILVEYRKYLGEIIEMLTIEINALDAQLNMYE